MKRLFIVAILCLPISGILTARGASITMNKRVWKLGERIEVKASGLNKAKVYLVGAFPRKTSNNNDPIKTRKIKNKTSGSVFMRLRTDQGVVAGKYEFHLYRPNSNNIIDKVNLVLKEGDTTPDPADPDPIPSNKNFTTSSATTDLNYADTVKFGSEYSKLGFKHLKYVKKVTKSQLSSMLAAKNQMHFHSGHGSSSGSISCIDGDLSASSLAKKIQVDYSIYCICSAFASSKWSNVMGSNANAVMGFNKTVTDGSCLSLASRFPAQLKSGQSYPMAWYKSNAAISGHKDRWAMYVKEGSKVVHYKAGGNTPKRYEPEGEFIVLSDQVSIDSVLLRRWSKRIPFDGLHNIAIAKKMDDFVDVVRFPFPTEKIKLAKRTAKRIAIENFERSFEGIKFDSITPIQRCETKDNCYTVGYDVLFSREYEGYELRSNFIVDHVSVLVTDEGIISTDTLWSEIEPFDLIIPDNWYTVSEILQIASYDISNTIRQPVVIIKFKSVYGISKNVYGQRILVPAYEFIADDGGRFVVSAYTGSLL